MVSFLFNISKIPIKIILKLVIRSRRPRAFARKIQKEDPKKNESLKEIQNINNIFDKICEIVVN